MQKIRPVNANDGDNIWQIFDPTICAGETSALSRDTSEVEALMYCLAPEHEVFVAEQDSELVGTYYLHANQRGGAHVANCGYQPVDKFTARRPAYHIL